jgi:hypothetical protein
MGVVVEQESIDLLTRHAQIPIGFLVDRVLALSLRGESGLEGIALAEVVVERPWRKDYDAVEGNAPTEWSTRFDLAQWGLLGGLREPRTCRRRGDRRLQS